MESKVKVFLNYKNFHDLKEFCCGKDNFNQVLENGWDIFSLLMNFLKEETVTDENLHYFEDIFSYISSISNPKEMLLAILEQFDPMIELALINLLFPALTTCCKKLMQDRKNRCQTLKMLSSSLHYYAESLNLPSFSEDTDVDNSGNIEAKKIVMYIEQCIFFGNNLLSEIFSHNGQHNEKRHLQDVKLELVQFCCGLLERLSYLNVDSYSTMSQSTQPNCLSVLENSESVYLSKRECSGTQVANKLCFFIRRFVSPFELFNLVSWRWWWKGDEKLSTEEREQVEMSRAVYVYLNVVNPHELLYFPQVLHPRYVVVNCLPSVLIFWKTQHVPHIHKGLELISCVLSRTESLSLHCSYIHSYLNQTYRNLQNNPSLRLLELAANIAIQCPATKLRQKAVTFLRQFLDKFDWPDRYYLLLHLLIKISHPGMMGYLIGYFKDKIADSLLSENSKSCQYFLEKKHLEKIYALCFNLPHGSDTDLLSEYDQILSALNLIRFLLIRDSSNKTGFHEFANSLQLNYFVPLRSALNLSRMHFYDELNRQKDSHKTTDEPALTINGISLPSLSARDRKQALESAINSFDVLQSVCIRVQELMEQIPSL